METVQGAVHAQVSEVVAKMDYQSYLFLSVHYVVLMSPELN